MGHDCKLGRVHCDLSSIFVGLRNGPHFEGVVLAYRSEKLRLFRSKA